MKQEYFAKGENTLKILHQESIRKMFYQVSIALYFVFIGIVFLAVGGSLLTRQSLLEGLAIKTFSEFFVAFFSLFIGVILPTASLILAQRFPPAPTVTFHNDIQAVLWKSGNNQLQLPFPTIHFATSRLLSKSGISTVMVTIFAVDDKPFFEGETPSQNPDMRYRKDLCVYKAGTQAEADESIEIIKYFMAGTYDDSPSKFDDI